MACLPLLVGANGTAPPADSFTFTAAGDYGSTARTLATLDAIAASQPAFHLALGDLSYDPVSPELDWCNLVRSAIPPSVPFELVTGNHEDFNSDPINGTGGNIDNFASCLPNQMPDLQGTYPRDYFFDFPAAHPIERVIVLSPEIAFEGGAYQSYAVGSEPHDWVARAIDTARALGIQWIVAAMHVNCITMGKNTCGDRAQDAMDLLISKRVDLILQGHDHTYQRSQQLAAPTETCAAIRPKSFEPGCTADDGQDGTYTRGRGSVLVIVGTGGASLSTVDPNDPDAPYFVTSMGRNTGGSFGFLQVEVSGVRMAASFVRSTPGTFSDQFVIEQH